MCSCIMTLGSRGITVQCDLFPLVLHCFLIVQPYASPPHSSRSVLLLSSMAIPCMFSFRVCVILVSVHTSGIVGTLGGDRCGVGGTVMIQELHAPPCISDVSPPPHMLFSRASMLAWDCHERSSHPPYCAFHGPVPLYPLIRITHSL